MNVLLCWSKERSRMMAAALHEWLPTVLSQAKPWMSEYDIDKGKGWSNELFSFLDETTVVIVSITTENVRSPWIYFECGRVSGRSSSSLICPYLLDNESAILADGPLSHFQGTKSEKEDTFRLLCSLNKAFGPDALSSHELSMAFEKGWPSLNGSLMRIRSVEPSGESAGTQSVKTELDVLAGGILNSDARDLLFEVGSDRNGRLLCSVTSGGHHYETNGKDLNDENTARSTAKWKAARQLLVRRGLLEMRGSKGELFAMTAKGFEVFDRLKEEK